MVRRALALRRAQVGGAPAEVAALLAKLGYFLVQLEQFDEAEACYREALATQRKLNDPSLPYTMQGLARLLEQRDQPAAAEALFREALGRAREVSGNEHLAVAGALDGLGLTLWRQGRNAEAEARLREALACVKKWGGTTAAMPRLRYSISASCCRAKTNSPRRGGLSRPVGVGQKTAGPRPPGSFSDL